VGQHKLGRGSLGQRVLGRVILMLATTLAVGLVHLAAWGQTPTPAMAPVRLNGEPLLEVVAAGGLRAEERATTIERQLEQLSGRDDIKVIVKERAEGPILFAKSTRFADQFYLTSVTQADADAHSVALPTELAQAWAEELNEALERLQMESKPGYFRWALVRAGLALLTALVIHLGLGWLWRRRLRPWAARLFPPPPESTSQFTGLGLLLRAMLFGARTWVWFSAITYVTAQFPITRVVEKTLTDGLVDGLLSRSISLGSQAYSLLDVLLLMASLLGLVVVVNGVTNLLKARVLHITGLGVGAQEAVAILFKYILIFLATVVVLQVWGIDLSSLALIASGLGVGIGLGLQTIVKDFISGLIMVFERPVQVGDFVNFGNVLGTVSRIGSRSTEIRTLDHVSIIVPNSRFIENEVINWSHRNAVSRIRLPVGVAYSSDPQMVKETLLDACQDCDQVLTAPGPQVMFVGFGDSALEFELVVWISQPSKQIVVKSDLYFAIEKALRHRQIEIPFPQRDLHIRSGLDRWQHAPTDGGAPVEHSP